MRKGGCMWNPTEEKSELVVFRDGTSPQGLNGISDKYKLFIVLGGSLYTSIFL